MSIDVRDRTKCMRAQCVTRICELVLDTGHGDTPNIYDMVWLVMLSKSSFLMRYSPRVKQ